MRHKRLACLIPVRYGQAALISILLFSMEKLMNSFIFRQSGRTLSFALLSLFACAAMAQSDLRDTLFSETDIALKAANAARANILAPKNYANAAKRYREAEDKLQRGKSIESIKKDLDAAAVSLRLAVDATRLAEVTLTTAIQARNDAFEADAAKFASQPWRDAEEKFASAAMRLEDGNVNSARTRASDAEKLYRDAELAAIKAQLPRRNPASHQPGRRRTCRTLCAHDPG